MKEEGNAHLASIRKGIWAILAVLLLMFGYDHTPVGRSELGAVIAVVGFVTGILMITFAIGAIVFRFLLKLKKMADDDKNT